MIHMKEIIFNILKRFKSPVVWASLGAMILWTLKTSGQLEGLGLDANSFNEGWNLVTTLAIAAGIINNPSDKSNF
jgi:uncharacterized membrane protein